MTISNIISSLNRCEREIAQLEKQQSTESQKEIRVQKNLDNLHKQMSNSRSTAAINSKLNQIRSKQTELARIEKKKADISKKLAAKNQQLRKLQLDLSKAQEKERKKSEKEQLDFQRKLTREIENRKVITEKNIQKNIEPNISEENKTLTYDVFISHSSDDKDDLVRPLAEELVALGIKVWYDEFELKLGDSLRQSIDKGMINSRYGVVVLSSSFFNRNWTNYELDGFVNIEMNGGKAILPIWHKVSKDEVQKFSPSLADKVALNTAMYSIKEIAKEIAEFLK